ncbi:unnamed protein product [Porites lobata]|uniref:DDE Tnp4 domain-containing protein n=1 Tax=Porites lobata TaxID=104759 RepID=A0ABN8Q7F9_9CNID|nr:unnamed protein product [Porites lobata]
MSNQRVVYNDHKRVHALKFQAVSLPNGLITNTYGPVEGRMHDARMLEVSQLYDDLQNFAFDPAGRAMCLSSKPTQGSLARPFQSWHSNKRCGDV